MPVTDSELRTVFRECDTDNSGFINNDEIRLALGTLYKIHSSDAVVNDAMASADTNNDGALNFREFKLLLHKYGTIMPMQLSRDFADVRVFFGSAQIPLGLKATRQGQLIVTKCEGLVLTMDHVGASGKQQIARKQRHATSQLVIHTSSSQLLALHQAFGLG